MPPSSSDSQSAEESMMTTTNNMNSNNDSSSIQRRFINIKNITRWVSILIHILSIMVYFLPISQISSNLISSPQPILDEMHLFSKDHGDVMGSSSSSSWKQLFVNDYWGRPMNSPSSHKSYRPLSILSFRWIYAIWSSCWSYRHPHPSQDDHPPPPPPWSRISHLFLQRLLNILLHSAMGEMVARIAYVLFGTTDHTTTKKKKKNTKNTPTSTSSSSSSCYESLLFYSLVKFIFLFHPTHIEAIVNAANRPHLLALCFIFLLFDDSNIIIPNGISMALFYVCALLACETAIFALPAIVCTLLYKEWIIHIRHLPRIMKMDNENDKMEEQANEEEEEEDFIFIQAQQDNINNMNHTTSNSNNHDEFNISTTFNTVDTPCSTKDPNNTPLSSSEESIQQQTEQHQQEEEEEEEHQPEEEQTLSSDEDNNYLPLYTRLSFLFSTIIIPQLYKILILIFLSLSYLYVRYSYDWIHIPDGLFRKAENPYSSFTGWKRILNYLHLLIIHVSKSLGIGFTDWIGFSHEYGYDCIPAITTWEDDTRILLLLIFILSVSFIGLQLWTWGMQDCTYITILALSWMATLFPITGIIKVGTCVADRIVIPSTVVGSILWAKITSRWICGFPSTSSRNKIHVVVGKLIFILLLGTYLYIKVDARSREWMDHTLLLESSLRTCPRSAKSNLEISKIYSGLDMKKYDLDKAMDHLETAEAIDPDYCDVHFQVAQILFRKQEYMDFEKRLLKGILCPFSMQGSLDLWNRYWTALLHDMKTPDALEAKKRYLSFQAILTDAVDKEKQREEKGNEERQLRKASLSSSRGRSSFKDTEIKNEL